MESNCAIVKHSLESPSVIYKFYLYFRLLNAAAGDASEIRLPC